MWRVAVLTLYLPVPLDLPPFLPGEDNEYGCTGKQQRPVQADAAHCKQAGRDPHPSSRTAERLQRADIKVDERC